MISIYHKTQSGNLEKLDKIKSGVLLNVENVTKSELHYLAELYELKYADLDDVLDVYELPRIERHENAQVIFVRLPTKTSTKVMMIIISTKYISIVSAGEGEFGNKIVEMNDIPPTTEQSKLFGYMMLVLTRQYTTTIKKVLDDTYNYRRFERVNREDVIELVYHEEILRQYLTALVPLKNILLPISEGKLITLHESDKDVFEDLYNAINQSVDTCRVQVENIQSLRHTQQIVFTNDLNYTMKLLASLTVLLTLPMIISSIYGMNVALPFGGHPQAFWMVIGFSFLTTILFFIGFVKNKWF